MKSAKTSNFDKIVDEDKNTPSNAHFHSQSSIKVHLFVPFQTIHEILEKELKLLKKIIVGS